MCNHGNSVTGRPSLASRYVSPGMEPPPERRARGRPRTRLHSVSEIAEYLSISRTTMYTLMDAGLPWVRVGYFRRLDRALVMRWIAERTKRLDEE